MRVGTLCYATEQGLGYLAKSFCDAGVVTDALVVRHSSHRINLSWYPNSDSMPIRPFDYSKAHAFCDRMDVMLFFETPFQWELIRHCREHGVKTVVMPMHECMPEHIVHQPDLWLCPSQLDLQWASWYIGGFPPSFIGHVIGNENGSKAVYLPVPVEGIKWRQRTKAEVFVHNAGHGGLKGRNGTSELLQAIRLVKSPAKFIIRAQEKHDWPPYPELLGRAELYTGTIPQNELYNEGDVFIFPEKNNGLSLPLQEARATGMLVMATDRFPINEWLPREPLIEPSDYIKMRIGPPYHEFLQAVVDPKDIAAKIDAYYGMDISDYSSSGLSWAYNNGWAVLRPKYLELLGSL